MQASEICFKVNSELSCIPTTIEVLNKSITFFFGFRPIPKILAGSHGTWLAGWHRDAVGDGRIPGDRVKSGAMVVSGNLRVPVMGRAMHVVQPLA